MSVPAVAVDSSYSQIQPIDSIREESPQSSSQEVTPHMDSDSLSRGGVDEVHRNTHEKVNMSYEPVAAPPVPSSIPPSENGSTENYEPVAPLPIVATAQTNRHRKDSRTESDISVRSTGNSISFNNAGAPPTGTLADLKRQRALQLQSQMSSKSGLPPLSELQSKNNGNYKGTNANSTVPPTERNGHSPSITSSSYENDSLYFSTVPQGDPPKRRYTSTTDIVGGDEEKHRCCVIL